MYQDVFLLTVRLTGSLPRISIEDSKGGNGLLTGNISYDHFKDIRFNARADVLNIEAINLDASQSETFYGNVSATGSVEFSGPMNALQLTVNAATSGDGQFHIPLSSSSNATGSNLLTFKEPVVIKKVDPYEAMVQRLQSQEKRESDFRMKLRVAANQGTEAFIEIDKATGNVLSGRGDGVIDIDLQPKKDIFNITGDYTIASGNYRFVALGHYVSCKQTCRRVRNIDNGQDQQPEAQVLDQHP